MEVITSPFPQTAWNVPWMHVAFPNAAAVGSGVAAAQEILARRGELPRGKPNLVIMGGDGGTSDIGFQALSGALERGHDFVYLCFDNEAYMNTGVQRSSATPVNAWTTTCPLGSASKGKKDLKKDLPTIMADHEIPYVATASPGHPADLMTKVTKAAQMCGPAFVHIFSPCPTGWRMKPDLAVTVAKLAVRTNVYPLYEVINGDYVLGRMPKNPLPVEEYFKVQGRFRHLSPEAIADAQAMVDRKVADLVWRASRTDSTKST
jgi:pyruvate ferredoxin oxidoreductase beta subunit